jgi:hypothetical protein
LKFYKTLKKDLDICNISKLVLKSLFLAVNDVVSINYSTIKVVYYRIAIQLENKRIVENLSSTNFSILLNRCAKLVLVTLDVIKAL